MMILCILDFFLICLSYFKLPEGYWRATTVLFTDECLARETVPDIKAVLTYLKNKMLQGLLELLLE